MQKKTVVILYEYFFPGYKAGGPIQSLVNMIGALQEVYHFRVITTGYDLNEQTAYESVDLDCWNVIQLPSQQTVTEIWYSSTHSIPFKKMHQLLTESAADFIFVNGLFTSFFSQPLWLLRFGRLKDVCVVVSPRGMLQPGALQVKPFKKKLYLALFKYAGLFKHIKWHATNKSEVDDIFRFMGTQATVQVAANVPKLPLQRVEYPDKQQGKLRLVYLSIITPKKNLLLLLRQLAVLKVPVSLAVYGPVKEPAYWELCTAAIKALPAHISVDYKGDIEPHLVQSIIAQYDAFISLTAGENFGHALFESLSCGRPVITSYYTPWNRLEASAAGWNVDIHDNENIQLTLQRIAMMDSSAFSAYCTGAWNMAMDYYHQADFIKNYCTLFSS